MGHSLMKFTLLGGKGGRQRIKSTGRSYLVRGLSCYKMEQLIYGKDGPERVRFVFGVYAPDPLSVSHFCI